MDVRVGRRRLLAGTATVAAIWSVLSACAPAEPPTPVPKATAAPPTGASAGPAPTTASAASAKPIGGVAPTTPVVAPPAQIPLTTKGVASVKYQVRDHPAEDHLRKRFGPRFTEITGTRVIIEDIPTAEYFNKVPILHAANQLGDLVMAFTYRHLPAWVVKGILKSIDEYAAAEKFDLSQYYKGVVDASRFEGKLYGLANTGHANESSIFFNRTMLKKAGLKAPDEDSPNDLWKWDDLLNAARALTKEVNGQTEVWGHFSTIDAFSAMNVNLRAFGSDHVNPDGKTSPIADDKGKAALRFHQDLMWKYKVRPKPTDLTAGFSIYQLFANEKVALLQDGTFPVTTLGPLVKDKFEWGGYILPPGPGGKRGATVFGNLMCLTTQSKEPEAAYQFMKYASSYEVGVEKLFMGTGSAGARPDVFQDARVVEAYPWYRIGHKVMTEAVDYNVPQNVRVLELENNIPPVYQEIWLNKIGAEDGAAKIKVAVEEILKQPR
jgi:multiple sugar transport system substrate-binding protein